MSEEAKRHPGVQETCAVLSSLPPAPARTLWHLLSCPWCLERMLNLALEEEEAGDLAGGGAGAGAPAPEALHQGLDRQELERDDRFARDGERAAALFEELVATPAAARRRLVESESRYGSPALAERLLEEAQGAGGTPAAEEEDARLALAVIDRVLVGRFGTGRVERLRASGWSLLGRARRLQDDGRGAEEALRAAGEAVEAIPVEALERALYCRELALLRRDEGRVDEALGLLTRAAEIYRAQGEPRQLGEALAEKGWTLLDEDPRLALRPLRLAAELVAAGAHPGPARRIRQGLALGYAYLGEREEALRMLAASRELAAPAAGPAPLLLAWADGEIAGELGRGEEAAGILVDVVRGLVREGRPSDAALATVDLLEVYAEAGHDGELAELRREIEGELVPRLPPQAGLALTVALRVAGRQEVAAPFLLVHTRRFIRRARSRAELVYEPSREPMVAIAWDQLPQSVRIEICTRAGAGEEVAGQRAAEIPQALRQLIAGVYQELTRTQVRWESMGGEEPRARG